MTDTKPVGFRLSPLAWTTIAVVAVLMVSLFWPNLRRLWLKTNPVTGLEAPNWSHAVLVPVIGLYYLWLRREELMAAVVKPVLPATRWPGLLIAGVMLLFAGALGGLFSLVLPDSVIAGFGLGWLAVAIVGLLLAGVDIIASARDSDARRLIGGGATLAIGLIGWLTISYGPGEALLGSTPAGYAGPLMLALGVLGFLAILVNWGIGTLLAGMLLTGYGIWPGQNDYLKDLGMVMTLFGAVLTLSGWQVMRVAWFPIAFLVCALPWPGLVYSKVAMPLQYLAANVAVVVLNTAAVETYVEGTTIVIEQGSGMEPRKLNVAEACAGMRSLMTFITAGAAIGFVFGKRPLWQRLTIVASAVPIAIICNVMRVSGQGLLDVYVSEKLSSGFAHAFAGLVMLLPAFVMLLGVVWILDHLFVEEEDEETPPKSTTRRKTRKSPKLDPSPTRTEAFA